MDFDTIYQYYFKDVYFYIRSLSANEDIAQEVAQETFTKALKAIDTFDGTKDIRAWLFTIARNTFYTYCRRQKIYIEQDFDETIGQNITTGNVSVIDQLADEENAFLIHQFLHDMKEPYKEVFSLRVFGELSFEKIGMLFGKSAGWARVTFYRAKNQIADYMEVMNNEGD